MKPGLLMVGAAAAALLMTGVGVSASSRAGSQRPATTVNVILKEWKLVPAPKVVPAGPVTFRVTNSGTLNHEFLVIKTSIPANALPVKNGEVSEAGLTKEIPSFKRGLTKTLTVTLTKGKYVLLCNIKSHYGYGQRSSFTVR